MEIWFVYLIISQKRLIVVNHSMSGDDYHLFLKSEGTNSEYSCKTFCIGYIYGSGIKVINYVEEFK
jgi:hypothetical protein